MSATRFDHLHPLDGAVAAWFVCGVALLRLGRLISKGHAS